MNSRSRGANGPKLATDLDRLLGLGIEGIEMAHAAVQEDENAGIGFGDRGSAPGSPEPVGKNRTCGQEAALKEAAAREIFRRVNREKHASQFTGPCPGIATH